MIKLISGALAALALLLASAAWAQDDWKDIELGDSRMKFGANTDMIEQVRRRRGYISGGTSYEELWLVSGGFLHYQGVSFDGGRYDGGGFTRFKKDRLAEMFSGMWPLADTDQKVAAGDIETFGTFNYAYAEPPGGRCLYVQQVFGGAGGANFGGDEMIVGVVCVGTAQADQLPAYAAGLLGALEKDGQQIFPVDKLK